MFNLEQSIAEWRRNMLAAGIKTREVVDELESHLREEIERQMKSGLSMPEAFNLATQKIGQPCAIQLEFSKLGSIGWNRRLAFAAWAMFFVSFFLPSYGSGSEVKPGWWCAVLQTVFGDGVTGGKWGCIHYELLTLANLLMLASPLLALRFEDKPRVLKWFGYMTLTASLLVWSYIGLLLNSGEGSNLRLGCFVWGVSFVLLLWSAFSRIARNKVYANT